MPRNRPLALTKTGWLTSVVALVAVFGLAGAGTAAATCTAPPDLANAIEEASSVFVGEVTEASFDSEEATLSVMWIWKGPDLSPELTVVTPLSNDGGEAGFRFRQGSTYIVVVRQFGDPIVIGECSGTTVYREEGQQVPEELQEAVGGSVGRLPGESARENEPDPRAAARTRAVWIGILAAVGMILVVVMQFQSRSDDDDQRRKPRLRGLFSRGRSGNRLLDKLRDDD